MPYYEKRIESGPMVEISRYFASRSGRAIPRSANRAETPESQAEVNERNAQKQMQRLIYANFAQEDLFVTFTHADELTEERAMAEERNLIDRLKRLRRKKGLPELKYIAVTEEQGRWHHHLIMSGGLTMEELQAVWQGRGRIHLSMLDDGDQYRGLARYLTVQHKPKRGQAEKSDVSAKRPRRKYQRRWHASRNLIHPVPVKKEIKRPPRMGEPKPPKGYRLLPDWVMGCDLLGYPYLYYTCMREDARPEARRCSTPKGKGTGAKPQRGAGRSPALPAGAQSGRSGKEVRRP